MYKKITYRFRATKIEFFFFIFYFPFILLLLLFLLLLLLFLFYLSLFLSSNKKYLNNFKIKMKDGKYIFIYKKKEKLNNHNNS